MTNAVATQKASLEDLAIYGETYGADQVLYPRRAIDALKKADVIITKFSTRGVEALDRYAVVYGKELLGKETDGLSVVTLTMPLGADADFDRLCEVVSKLKG